MVLLRHQHRRYPLDGRTLLIEIFPRLFADIKRRMQMAQTQAVEAINAYLSHSHLDIGQIVYVRQQLDCRHPSPI